ncbi:unnamed protein product [marine sediment metagenome]|uniref:Uncharacterized protein n=1 Tax=marine sediment metagenome TaxID=412755 RepID=X1AY85_9ZZZZ
MSYVICEYDKVKQEFPEFKRTMENLATTLRAKCAADWSPKTFGGLAPTSGQFGETTVLPALFRDDTMTANNAGNMITWEQWLPTLGHRTIMSGSGGGGIILEDYKVGLAGIAFLDKAIRVSEIKMQISDKKLPRINIEEALAYNKPAIIFENGYILDEETGFDLYAYVTTRGPQRIKLIGLQMNRVPNRLQVTNTGATL